MMISEWKGLETLSSYEIRDCDSLSNSSLAVCSLVAHPTLLDRILEAQKLDPELVSLSQSIREKTCKDETRVYCINSRVGY